MKTKFFLSAFLLLGISIIAEAKFFRLSYPGTAVAGVDYTDFNTLQSAAVNGDTVQVYGSNGQIFVTKQLVFQGFGYNLDAHAGLQKNNTNNPSYFSNMYLRAGSNGTIIEGISAGTFFIGNDNNTPAGIGVSNITFRRCMGDFSFQVNHSPVTNLLISSCAIGEANMSHSNRSDITNLTIYNSIIRRWVNLYNFGSTASIINCVSPSQAYNFWQVINAQNASCLVKNCIFARSGASVSPNTVYENNFFQEAIQGGVIGSNNRWSQNWADLFQRINGVDDRAGVDNYAEFKETYYQLKAGSLAINGGTNAAASPTDCGIFGGEAAYAYKLGGVPAIPAIYRLDAPSLNTSGNPYNVTISVRSNN